MPVFPITGRQIGTPSNATRRGRSSRSGIVFDASLSLAAQIGGVAVAFVVSVVAARTLGPAGAGVVQLALTLGNQLALVLSLGAAVSVVRFIALDPADGTPFSAGLLLASFLVPVVTGLTVLAPRLAPSLLDGSGEQGLAITLAVPLAWLFVVQDLTAAVFRGQNHFKRVAALTLGARAFVGSALILTLVGVKSSANGAMVAVVLANAVSSAVFAYKGLRVFGASLRGAGSTLRRMVAFNLVGHAGTVLQEASYRLDLFLVAGMRSTAEAGVYGVAGLLHSLLWYLPTAIGTVLMSRMPTASDKHRLLEASRATMALMLALGTVAAAAVPLVVPAVFGDRFGGAVVPFLILLPGSVLLSVWKVLMNALAGMGYPSLKLPSALAGAAVGLGLDLWLIPFQGIRGAALAASTAYTVTTLWLLPTAARVVGARAWEFLIPDFAGAARLLRRSR